MFVKTATKYSEECNTNEVEIESTPGTINLEKLITSKFQCLEEKIDCTITQKLAESYKIINDQVKKVNESYSGVCETVATSHYPTTTKYRLPGRSCRNKKMRI